MTTHHALAVADNALLMLGETEFVCGAASEILTEPNLRELYGVDLKRDIFGYAGKTVQTLVPVLVFLPSAKTADTNGRDDQESPTTVD
jgi:iron complex transport system ATP-binding protein